MFLPGNCDDCINRRFNFVSPLIALQFPVGTDQTMAGAIGAGKPAEAFVGKRRDRNLFIGGIAVKRTDSGGVSIYPVSDCAVSVMIIGIHVAGPDWEKKKEKTVWNRPGRRPLLSVPDESILRLES